MKVKWSQNKKRIIVSLCFCLYALLGAWVPGPAGLLNGNVSVSPALAEQMIVLPDGGHSLVLPDGLVSYPVTEEDANLWGLYLGDNLDMQIFTYQGNGLSMEDNAKALTEAGRSAEIREINGITVLCYRDLDEADNTPCIGYVYPVDDRFVELTFWYGTEEAGEMSRTIMESLSKL